MTQTSVDRNLEDILRDMKFDCFKIRLFLVKKMRCSIAKFVQTGFWLDVCFPLEVEALGFTVLGKSVCLAE